VCVCVCVLLVLFLRFFLLYYTKLTGGGRVSGGFLVLFCCAHCGGALGNSHSSFWGAFEMLFLLPLAFLFFSLFLVNLVMPFAKAGGVVLFLLCVVMGLMGGGEESGL
jgi:hypothetical protein